MSDFPTSCLNRCKIGDLITVLEYGDVGIQTFPVISFNRGFTLTATLPRIHSIYWKNAATVHPLNFIKVIKIVKK